MQPLDTQTKLLGVAALGLGIIGAYLAIANLLAWIGLAVLPLEGTTDGIVLSLILGSSLGSIYVNKARTQSRSSK